MQAFRGALLALALGFALGGAEARADEALLAPIFSDGAVLQRDQPIRVFGRAAPGARVTVTLDRSRAQAEADARGEWAATLPARAAGGPFTLAARTDAGAEQIVRDVLIGDVWLCSGQSNMVLQVHRALDARAEIANAGSDWLRMFAVPLTAAPAPQRDFGAPASWQAASPQTVPEWSAACYFFARELQRTINVPMGMVNASWGGSNIRAWMREATLDALGYGEGLEILSAYAADEQAGQARFAEAWQNWWRAEAQGAPWAEPRAARDWRPAPAGLGYWENWGVAELAAYNGMVWYRADIRLTAAQAAQAATLAIGRVDEIDLTWVNGAFIGGQSGAHLLREYQLPAGALRAGDNAIVVNAYDTYATGGLYGPDDTRALRLADGTIIPLSAWRYRIAPAGLGAPPRMPWEAAGGLGTLYNGMIAPIGPYNFRGVAWYQGETNVGEGDYYRRQLHAWMADWRGLYGADLPFLIVQLAGWGPPQTAPTEAASAALREAQRLAALEDSNAALVIAIDIGERTDVHPANKQDVGRRLARAARALIYGARLSPSGPTPAAARRAGDAVAVRFADLEGALVAYGAWRPIGFELCGAARGDCRFVDAVITGADTVSLAIPAGLAPARVRYCWADSPVCTLYDGANGLPAGPFEAAIAP